MSGDNAGFTIAEMLVAIGIFIILGMALVTLWHASLNAWARGERRRKVYERAQTALSQIALDLEAAYTREPVTAGIPTARLFCTREANGRQRLSLVRTFETGPERAYTFYAGSGRGGRTYTDGFTGDGTSLKAIGGLIGVSYRHEGRELRRATLGPPAAPGGSLRSTTGSRGGGVLVDDVLHVGFRFWTQQTTTWNDPPPSARPGRKWRWPETVWDSTRGAGVVETDPRTNEQRPFVLDRGPESFNVPFDDVFPEIVELTLVVEPDEFRTVRTDLIEPVAESGMVLRVASTKGFDPPSARWPCLLVGGEWVKYTGKGRRSFTLSERGLRGTVTASHPKGTAVRAGTTFVMRAHVPAHRADWSTDADFRQRTKR